MDLAILSKARKLIGLALLLAAVGAADANRQAAQASCNGNNSPSIGLISPSSGPAAGGTVVTISGTSLGCVSVTFGGVAATNVVATGTSVTATAPPHAAGAVSLVVMNPNIGVNANATAQTTYTYVAVVVPPVASATTTAIASSPNPSQFGQQVTLTATVTGNAPTGSVTFFDGATPIGTGSVSGSGLATLSTSALAIGSHAITASYGGDSNNLASSSAALVQAVGLPADSIHLRQMQMLATRQSAQISGQAISGATSEAIGCGFGDCEAVTPNGSGFTYNFAADAPAGPHAAASDGTREFLAAPDRPATTSIDGAFAALGYAKATAKARPAVVQRDWLGWIDLRGLSVTTNGLGNDLRGDQVNVTAGLTRRLTPDLLVGGFAGYERLDFNSDALSSRLKGEGWTAGGYLGWRLAPTLRFDLTLARSGIAYDDSAGTASASFPGERWLASGGLTGTHDWQGLVLQPSAKVYALWERDAAYTDSLGIAQPANSFSAGRASAGGKVSYPVAWTATVALAPYAGAYGDYYFTGNDAVVAGVPTTAILLQGWSARLIAGLDLRFRGGGTLGVGGELGGIGSNSDTTIWTYRARGSVPF